MKRPVGPRRATIAGPSQRQLRTGELVRHALVEVLREEELIDEALTGVSVTLSEVRMSPDLKHAYCFAEPLGGDNSRAVIAGLNRMAKFLRGRLGRHVDLKFTPDLKFMHDPSFDRAREIERLFDDPRVRQDLSSDSGPDPSEPDPQTGAPGLDGDA